MKDLLKLDLYLKKWEIPFKEEEVLAPYTTIKIGGPCLRMIFPQNIRDLVNLLNLLEKENLSYFILGGGSNLLVGDRGFKGVVINLRNFKGIEVIEKEKSKLRVKVLAGTLVNRIIGFTFKEGFSGLEFLVGVPATLGGAIRMNAGAFNQSVSEVVKKVELYQKGEIKVVSSSSNLWGYRWFKEEGVILSAELEFVKEEKEKIWTKMQNYIERRKKTQPFLEKTFGSVFKNPPCCYAGWFIEACGLKGYKVGRAKISEKHANFIVNLGGAKAEDVLELIRKAQEEVYLRFQTFLEPEVKFLGCSL
ncbi:MAG: UDP-N-acetylmuramate dehydrogenase [Thermodesulfobacterium sp.]|nr:UDP-N-acetylmuramate dehydrogenase [Thermodesulfobacterium sp.]